MARGVEVVTLWKGEPIAWEHVTGRGAATDLPEDGSWTASEDGELTILSRRTEVPRYRDPAPELDRGLAWSMTATMGLGIAFVLAVGFVPPAGGTVTVEALAADDPLLAYLRMPLADQPVPRTPLPVDGSGPIDDGPGRPMAEAAGVSGATDGPRTRRGRIRVRGEERVRPRIPRAVPDPRTVGILGVLASFEEAEHPGAIAGAADAEGWTASDAYGRPLAELVGMGHGASGFDMVGTGRGGCWPGDDDCGEGTVGVGPGLGFGGTGRGSTCGETTCQLARFGAGFGGGLINLRGREEEARRRRSRPSEVPNPIRRVVVERDQGLTRQQVRRAIGRHRDAIRHCYASTAAAAGGESGEVEIGLAISPDGSVLSTEVLTDSLSAGDAAECIAGIAARARFPRADAATIASIPFGLDVFGG